MTKTPEGKYQATSEEISRAESMMTEEQKTMSAERERRMGEWEEKKSRMREWLKTLTPEKLQELKQEYKERGNEKAGEYNNAGGEDSDKMFAELNMARREEVMSIAKAIAQKIGGEVRESEWGNGAPLVEVELDADSSLVVYFHPATPGKVNVQYWADKPDYPQGYPDMMTPEEIAEKVGF